MFFIEKILNLYVVKKISAIFSMAAHLGLIKKNFYVSENILNEFHASFSLNQNTSASLDIGSGPIPKNPFKANTVYGADLRSNENENVCYADISSGLLPFDSGTFDYVTAFDVLEHIQRVAMVNHCTNYPFIALINEIFRVLKPGGIFFSIQPCYPAKQAFQDPTHVNIMSEDTLFLYFCEPAWGRIYGYEGSFKMIKDGWIGCKYFAFMRKSADNPISDIDFIQK